MPLELLPLDPMTDREVTQDSRDSEGYEKDGFDKDGFDRRGFNADDYDEDGLNAEGYDSAGYDSEGYNSDGYDRDGYDEHGFDIDGFNEDGYDADGYDADGDDSYGDHRGGDEFFQYGNPEFEFHSLDESGARVRSYSAEPDIAYLGIELEFTSRCTPAEHSLLARHDRLLWAKPDGSVAGYEMCVHPMTYAYAMKHFPFDLVKKLKDAGSSVYKEGNGLHVHVSRDGFDNDSHLLRWTEFLWDNAEQCREIGGRSGLQWGNFDPYARGNLAYWISNGPGLGDRYLAVNLQNDDTVEVRFMSSTTGPKTLRRRIQFVASTVEYARQLTPEPFSSDYNLGWDSYVSWLADNQETYPELAGKLASEVDEADAALAGFTQMALV